ncbi:hypothetical protein [Clostridium botulinum]|uniref:hypothetical protein n=1 Tax=Clostridium botulinum TaxID=1491 RepID=UPI000773F3B9|nr:hypothetical protein [Clostridium botulinum]MBY6932291.1 hypothetical protein [Clostridium botulinum]NFG22199.1 hypothetical protein [Clostridium botulinum]NFO82709.1 hypothetical protein [Clostridium botulinum]
MKLSEKQVQAFMEMLYKNGDKELKRLFEHQRIIKSAVLDEISNIMLIYVVENDVMNMTLLEQRREMQKLSGLINNYMKADAEMQISIIYSLLENTVNDTFRLYSYNSKKKDINKILKENFKGKHFSSRVWDNENEVAKYLNKQLQDFIKGKVSVNKIKKNVETTFNSGAYNVKRLAETEISRCQSAAFDKFCNEVEVKKVKYNATLCNTCGRCMEDDGKIFDFKNKPKLPKHPFCQCYYDIADDEINNNNHENDIVDTTKKIATVEDAKKALIDDVGFIEVEDSFMENVDSKLIIDNTNQLLKLEDKFGVIHNSASTIFSKNTGATAYVNISPVSPRNQNLSLNYRSYKNKKDLIESEKLAVESGWSMPVKLTDDELSIVTVTHEYGHMLQNNIVENEMIKNGYNYKKPYAFMDLKKKSPKAQMKWYSDMRIKVEKANYAEIIDIAKNNNSSFNLKHNISNYGSKSYSEFFAEVFMNSQLSKPNELGIAMQEWLKEKKLIKIKKG